MVCPFRSREANQELAFISIMSHSSLLAAKFTCNHANANMVAQTLASYKQEVSVKMLSRCNSMDDPGQSLIKTGHKEMSVTLKRYSHVTSAFAISLNVKKGF